MEERLNQQIFVDLLIEKHGLDKKQSEKFVKEFFLLIEESLKNDKLVKIKGLGSFKLIDVESRESVNINTGERFVIEGYAKISFTPESALREIINKPFAHFETVLLNENTVLEDTIVEKEESEVLLSDIDASSIPSEDPSLSKTEIVDTKECQAVDEPCIPLDTTSVNSSNEIVQQDNSCTIEVDLSNQQASLEGDGIADEKEAPKTSSSLMKYLIILIFTVLLICGGVLFFIYNPNIISNDILSNEETTIIIGEDAIKKVAISNVVVPETNEIVIEADTVEEKPKVTIVEPNVVEPKVSRTVEKGKVDGTDPDSISYIIKGTQTTYVVKQGETLTRISLRFYGTKNLWPYIVKHNPDVIKQPNNVPYGTLLKIPELIRK